eukprot:3499202-Alexandrium_andersonii.AAC.1
MLPSQFARCKPTAMPSEGSARKCHVGPHVLTGWNATCCVPRSRRKALPPYVRAHRCRSPSGKRTCTCARVVGCGTARRVVLSSS